MVRTFASAVLFLLVAAGCQTTRPPSHPFRFDLGARLETPESAILLRTDARIESLDGSWVVVPNSTAKPPVVSPFLWKHSWLQQDDSSTWYKKTLQPPVVSIGVNWHGAIYRRRGKTLRGIHVYGVVPGSGADRAGITPGALLKTIDGQDAYGEYVADRFPLGQAGRYRAGDTVELGCLFNHHDPPLKREVELSTLPSGGIPVRVHVDGRDRPLFAVIAFFHVWSTAPADVRRVWHLRIPQAYVDASSGGRVARVFQPYKCRLVITDPDSYEFVSWAMWLSDQPLWTPERGDFGFDWEMVADDGADPAPTVTAVDANGPADEAGLQVGDRILAIDDTSVPTKRRCEQQLARYMAGDYVLFAVHRDDGEHQFEIRATLPGQ